jgi:hypothetical protein
LSLRFNRWAEISERLRRTFSTDHYRFAQKVQKDATGQVRGI